MTNIEPMPRPSVGVAVILETRQGLPLMSRIGKHAGGTWCWPGGHLEGGETVLQCAMREVREEVGVTCDTAQILPWITEDFFPAENKHYITLYVVATTKQVPTNMEPEKCKEILYIQNEYIPSKVYPMMVGVKESWDRYCEWKMKQGG